MNELEPRVAMIAHPSGLGKTGLMSLAKRLAEQSSSVPVGDFSKAYPRKQTVLNMPKGRVKKAKPFSYYVDELKMRYTKSRLPRGCRTLIPVVKYRPMTDEEHEAQLKQLNRKSQFSFGAVVTPYPLT